MTKILWNHDHTAKPIGKYDFSDGRINFVFEEDVEISHEMMFEIFGNAGISVDRMERRDDGKVLIKAGHILEFSFPPVRAISPSADAKRTRERFAMTAMQAIIATCTTVRPDDLARWSAEYADALIAELNKEQIWP